MKFVLPKAAIPDVKALADLSTVQLRQLKAIYEGSSGRQEQDVLRISKMLGVPVSDARSIQLVVEFAMSLSGQMDSQQVAEEFAAVLESQSESASAQNLKSNIEHFAAIFRPSSKRKQAEKVHYLVHGPTKTVDKFRTVCELRPVFADYAKEGEPSLIQGHVCVVLLLADSSDMEGKTETTVLTLTSESLSELESCIARARLKLGAIEAKYGKAVDVDGA